MALLDNLQSAIPAIDYLRAQDSTIYATVLSADYQSRLDANGGSDTLTVDDGTDIQHTVKIIVNTDAPLYYPLTSLVDGKRYDITVDDSGRPEWMSEQQQQALQAWFDVHLRVFKAAKEALFSADTTMAQEIFHNKINGVEALYSALLADIGSNNPTVSLTDTVPGIKPALTWGEWLARLAMWSGLESYLDTPLNDDGITPKDLLTKAV